MISSKRKYWLVIVVCFSFFSFSIITSTSARDVTIEPSIGITGEYNDNVLFSRANEVDDYVVTISPSLDLTYISEVTQFKGKAIVDIIRYDDSEALDKTNQRYELDAGHKMTERLTVDGGFTFIDDTTLDSELEETGIVSIREDRKRYIAKAGMSYVLSEVSSMGLGYQFSKTDYEFPTTIDSDNNNISFSYHRYFNDRLDTLSITPGYSYYDSDTNEVDSYKTNIGWTHQITETYQFTISGGGRYTKTFSKTSGQRDSNWSAIADVNLLKRGEVSSTRIGFVKELRIDTQGEPIDVNKFYLNLSRDIQERLGVGFYGNIYFTRSDSVLDNRDRDYLNLSPFINYRLTESHSLKLTYSYSREENKDIVGDQERDRNRVWLGIYFRFPKKM